MLVVAERWLQLVGSAAFDVPLRLHSLWLTLVRAHMTLRENLVTLSLAMRKSLRFFTLNYYTNTLDSRFSLRNLILNGCSAYLRFSVLL